MIVDTTQIKIERQITRQKEREFDVWFMRVTLKYDRRQEDLEALLTARDSDDN